MSTVDVYRITDRLDDDTLDIIVERLETRGRHPRALALIDEYLDAMRIDAAGEVLDIGCGTGVISRRIAQRPGFKGRIIGIDLSAYLTHTAARLAEAEGVGQRIDFRTGDSHTLGIPENSIDAVVAHTLLSHVDDPAAVIAQIARILKPGGVAALFDGDFASMTFGTTDPAEGRRNDDTIVGAIVTQPRLMRQMPELLQAAGLRQSAVFGHVVADVGRMDYWGPAVESFRKVLPRSGAWTVEQADRWAASMRERSERGVFFAASNYYSYLAVKPG